MSEFEDELSTYYGWTNKIIRVSLSGYDVAECRRQLLAFLINDFKTDNSWRNHCIKYWICELDGLAGVW